ncbi:ATP-binding protein [Campylobacter sp. faydin G-140]|uniref:AAA family ATPase n=1 Tax=Campylobacter anatolicus TaxID=2829105 RepID=UPI001BA25383|nr:ATP-binding protein [Campylobacter anatolicus]MBR8466483.1 ATP-binding protein [Campylobacter anatolicus]
MPNFDGVLTSQDISNGVTKAEALQKKLGISVINSHFTLSDVGGAEALKEYVSQLEIAEQHGYKSKGIFLIGVPGTGKTFFPTCLAGQLKRPLIMLNLEVLKETGSPINKLNEVFNYLNSQNEKTILLIDEIEKMVGNADDSLTGRLMTILSSLGDNGSEYPNLDILIFATANNLESILENQPALIRRGRFDELFFVNLPNLETAHALFEMYIKKYDLEILTSIYCIDDIIAEIENEYRDSNLQANRFCYTPSEIQSFIKRLKFLMIAKGSITQEDIEKNIKLFIPIIKTSQKGIAKILAQKELFVEI